MLQAMGLRNALSRWLNAPERSSTLQERVLECERTLKELQLERPAFVTELEALAERCHDILDQAESKRGRVAARESRLNKREQAQDQGELPEMTDRDRQKAQVRHLLRARGYNC